MAPIGCLNEVRSLYNSVVAILTVRPSFNPHLRSDVSTYLVKSALSEHYPSQFCMRTSFLPNIDGSGCYKAPFLSIQASSDHRENVEGNGVKDDARIGGRPNANSCNCCTLHYGRGIGRGEQEYAIALLVFNWIRQPLQ